MTLRRNLNICGLQSSVILWSRLLGNICTGLTSVWPLPLPYSLRLLSHSLSGPWQPYLPQGSYICSPSRLYLWPPPPPQYSSTVQMSVPPRELLWKQKITCPDVPLTTLVHLLLWSLYHLLVTDMFVSPKFFYWYRIYKFQRKQGHCLPCSLSRLQYVEHHKVFHVYLSYVQVWVTVAQECECMHICTCDY